VRRLDPFEVGMVALAVIVVTLLVITLLEAARAVAADDYWWRLARCETGAAWHQRGQLYVGGLGIWAGNWNEWAPRVGVYKPAYLASPAEQIRVAKYGRAVDGAYWGCFRIVGLPW
jgi:hypothetical protein